VPHVPIERHRLDNGLRVILSPDERAPVVAVNLWYDVGSKHEQPGKTGFAHLFEHMMFQGSEHVAKGEHFALVQGAGGTLNATTWLDRTNYFETMPSHELELALWLESDRMASLLPAMTQEKLDNQRDVVKNERRLRVDNQPYGSWDEKIQGLVYPEGHPYHHPTIGSMADLSAASLDDVREFFATWYAPNNAVLTIAGGFDPAESMEMVARHFGSIPRNEQLPGRPDTRVAPVIGREVRETVHDRVPLPRIYVAYRVPPFGSEGFDAMELSSDLLAGGRASRLYRSLIRERRLAQDVVAFAFPLIGDATMFALWATARPGVAVGELEEALFGEIDRLRADGPSEDELQRARTLHRAAIESSLERVSERADRLSMYGCLFDEPERVNDEVARYQRVDAQAARSALAEWLVPENRVVLTYLPAESAVEPPGGPAADDAASDTDAAADSQEVTA
jgi:predicted Zn-dependent peptidase